VAPAGVDGPCVTPGAGTPFLTWGLDTKTRALRRDLAAESVNLAAVVAGCPAPAKTSEQDEASNWRRVAGAGRAFAGAGAEIDDALEVAIGNLLDPSLLAGGGILRPRDEHYLALTQALLARARAALEDQDNAQPPGAELSPLQLLDRIQ